MSLRRWATWSLFGAGVIVLFWFCALIGSWSPAVARLSVMVHGKSLASYGVDTPIWLAPLSSQVIGEASKDQVASTLPGGRPSPTPTRSGGPTPTASTSPSGPTPSPTILPIPTLPTATPSVPTPPPTPTVPVATPTPTVLPTPPVP